VLRFVFASAVALVLAGPAHVAAQAGGAAASKAQMPIRFTSANETAPDGGVRAWSKNGADSWSVRQNNGAVNYVRVVRHATVNGCGGDVVVSADNSAEFFIPDSLCNAQLLMSRRLYPAGPPGAWGVAAAMQQIEYAEAEVQTGEIVLRLDNGKTMPVLRDTIFQDDRGFVHFKVFGFMGDMEFAVDCRTRAAFSNDGHGRWTQGEEFDDAVYRFMCR
jgi:hypothetical protein